MAMKINEIVKQAKKEKLDIKWVLPGDDAYDTSRKIANARFSYSPAAIAYCGTAESVAGLFKIFKEAPPKLRVRSGGHQHEGMCSADCVLLIDLSRMCKIGHPPKTESGQRGNFGPEEVWIQPGCLLGDVYKKMWDSEKIKPKDRRIFPGGGCPSVRVGGLVQGGGWGVWLRKFGLTCDNLLEVEIVLANGDKILANEKKNDRLFWAIRGGGGGNFGVVTNFRFRIYPFPKQMTRFRLRWGREHRVQIAQKWMHLQAESPRELTSFCRLSVVPRDKVLGQDEQNNAVIVAGMFCGSEAELRKKLEPFYKIAEPVPHPPTYRIQQYAPVPNFNKNQLSTIDSLASDLQPGLPWLSPKGRSHEAPRSTCGKDSFFPHKVSSAFPRGKGSYDQLAGDLSRIVDETPFDQKVNRYISLHGFGGKVNDKASNATAFPYRDKDFLLQFQAWWSTPKESMASEYIRWITDLRKNLEGVEGAFINFPDISLVKDRDRDRIELLKYYYGKNLAELRRVKGTVDPKNIFSFGMSIPPK